MSSTVTTGDGLKKDPVSFQEKFRENTKEPGFMGLKNTSTGPSQWDSVSLECFPQPKVEDSMPCWGTSDPWSHVLMGGYQSGLLSSNNVSLPVPLFLKTNEKKVLRWGLKIHTYDYLYFPVLPAEDSRSTRRTTQKWGTTSEQPQLHVDFPLRHWILRSGAFGKEKCTSAFGRSVRKWPCGRGRAEELSRTSVSHLTCYEGGSVTV